MQTDPFRITSRDNERLKSARRVRDGKVADKVFLEGVRLVADAIRSDIVIETLFISSGSRQRIDQVIDVSSAGSVYEVSDPVFQSLADTKSAQGIIAIVDRPAGT